MELVGKKVKIPTKKSILEWGGVEYSNAIRTAKEIKQDFLYVNGYDEDLKAYEVWYAEGEEGDYFAEEDLELYD